MKLDFLQEPELEFGDGKHIDIRFGLMNYGVLDYTSPLAPKSIRLGLVGTQQTIEDIIHWLERCQNGIAAKPSKYPNLFPRFPGFGPDSTFYTSLVIDPQLHRPIQQREFDVLVQKANPDQVIIEAVHLFIAELEYLTQNTNADVLMCAMPMSLLEAIKGSSDGDVDSDDNRPEADTRLDFHDMLKAKAMSLRKPTQLVWPMTYDNSKRRLQRRGDKVQQLQDEATRAWNIYTALYYKAGGKPWRLERNASQLTACYVGIGFYKTLDESRLLTSAAQVFNERGDGVIVRGGVATISKDDLQPHLQASDAYTLLDNALATYALEHHTSPARVVIYKTSICSGEELDGFMGVARDWRIYSIDIISISETFTRLYRAGIYPPLRGTFLSLDDQTHILYTRGSIDFFSVYPGMYVPRPLLFRCEHTEQTPRFLAQEILALTKMNWNSTQFDNFEPITVRAARQVGTILKYINEGEPAQTNYKFYM